MSSYCYVGLAIKIRNLDEQFGRNLDPIYFVLPNSQIRAFEIHISELS